MNRLPLGVAALVSAMASGMGQSSEVVETTGQPGLGEWLRNNNRGMFARGKRPRPLRAKRLQRATGPGSLNELNEMGALVRAAKYGEAKDYYQRCLNINYRKGKPKLHPRMVGWYQQIVAEGLS